MAKAATHYTGVYGAHLHVATTRDQMKPLRRKYDLAKPDAVLEDWMRAPA